MSGFSPYVLFRRGTIGMSALDGLVPERTLALLAAVEDRRAERERIAARLADELHAVIPRRPAEHRRDLLRLRRDVHNDRPPKESSAAEELPSPCRELLDEWRAAWRHGTALGDEAGEVFSGELDHARKTLADVAADEYFQRGVQLSGEDVYREVMAYAADPFDARRKPSRRRRAESTITSYAYRVVFKPSPFGSFTEIGAQPWEAAPASGGRVMSSRLAIGLLGWMTHQLHRVDGASDLLRIRLNNTLTIRGEHAIYVRRPMEGADDGFQPDKVVRARNSGLVGLLVELLGEHDRCESDLRNRLVAAGLDVDSATKTIDQLVKAGLCHRGLGLPDQATRTGGTIARLLRSLGNDQAERCAEVFEGLQRIEDDYGAAPARQRTALFAELRALVRRFVDLIGCPPPAEEAMRAAIYEDLGTTARAVSWRPDLLDSNREAFSLLQRLVPLLDDATIEKLGLYAFFVERYGEEHSGVPLLELYEAFAGLTSRDASAVMCGVGDPEAERVQALRAEFFSLLEEWLAESDGTEFALPPDRLRAFVDRLPATVAPWASAAFRVQIAEKRVVVNGITTGHGVFFSRYCDLLAAEPGEWDLGRAVREAIGRSNPRQTDITAALGLNFNLHPRLTPGEVVYPGSVARPDAEGVLTLADVSVRAVPETRRLELVSTRDGEPIDLVPMNFLYPAAAPMLYRFLCVFAPSRTYRGGLWEQADGAGRGGDGERPRVRLGDLVLDRRTWRFPVSDVPVLNGVERQELDAFAKFDQWRRSVGLPRRGFFRLLAAPVLPEGERDLAAETRQWALEARSARLHKPHYIDTSNPFLLQVFAKQVLATPGGTVLFQECLPDEDSYRGESGADSAEEFFVEHNLSGDDHAEH